VSFERLNEDTYRRGYHSSRERGGGLVEPVRVGALYEWRKDWRDFEINAHVHDALLMSVDRDEAWEVAQFCREEPTKTREIGAGSCRCSWRSRWGGAGKGMWSGSSCLDRGEFEQKLKELLEY